MAIIRWQSSLLVCRPDHLFQNQQLLFCRLLGPSVSTVKPSCMLDRGQGLLITKVYESGANITSMPCSRNRESINCPQRLVNPAQGLWLKAGSSRTLERITPQCFPRALKVVGDTFAGRRSLKHRQPINNPLEALTFRPLCMRHACSCVEALSAMA